MYAVRARLTARVATLRSISCASRDDGCAWSVSTTRHCWRFTTQRDIPGRRNGVGPHNCDGARVVVVVRVVSIALRRMSEDDFDREGARASHGGGVARDEDVREGNFETGRDASAGTTSAFQTSERGDEDASARTIDELYNERIGNANREQLFQYTLAALAWFPAAFLTLTPVFAARLPDWKCIEESKCGSSSDICAIARDAWTWVDAKASIVSEWDLVCEHEYKVQLADSIFFFGFLLGAGIMGQTADSKGRLFGLYLSTMLASAGALLAAFTGGYWSYLLYTILRGFGCGGLGVASYVLCLEFLGIKWRAILGIATQYFWSGGIAIMSGVAYTMPRWRSFTAFCGAFGFIYVGMCYKFLLESPRWYLATGRADKASEILTRLAKGNPAFTGRLPPLKEPRTSKGLNVTAVLPFPALRHRLFAMAYLFCITSMVYYGLSLNVGSLSGSVYMNTFIGAITEFPAHAFAQISADKLGRKKTELILMGTAAVGTFSSSMFTGSFQVFVSMFGRFGIAGSFNMVYLYTAELFPTIVRSACLGTCSLAARVGGIIAPAIIYARIISPAIPPVLFGIAAASACLVTLTLPETRGVVIEESLAGAASQDMGSSRLWSSAREAGFTRLVEQPDSDSATFDENLEL